MPVFNHKQFITYKKHLSRLNSTKQQTFIVKTMRC